MSIPTERNIAASDLANNTLETAKTMGNTPPKRKPLPSPTKNKPTGKTESHRLSNEDQHGLVVAKQPDDPADVADLGWHRPSAQFEESLVAGLSNEDLWMLMRRFDKQIYNVKAVPDTPPQDLDLIRAADDEFSPEKLRSTLERFYMTVVVSLASLMKHFARLRSWKEPQRTGLFCAIYCIAWLRDSLIATLLSILLGLILSPAFRTALFPPAPLALVDKSTGGIQKSKAGVLGSHDSITGAPENFKGEAVEDEASNLVAGVASVAVGSAIGKNEEAIPEDVTMEKKIPDPTDDVVLNAANAQNATSGELPTDKPDKTRHPMKQSVVDAAILFMDVVNDISDTHEKFANALSENPPFSKYRSRLRLAGVIFPVWLISMFTSSYIMIKTAGLLTGFLIFGDPLVIRGIEYLNRYYPNWPQILRIGNTLLKGIPTNAQLTLTLLRISEASSSPLPPPPISRANPPSRPASLCKEDLTLNASHSEIDEVISRDQLPPSGTDSSRAHTKTWASGLIALFRETTAGGVESKRAVDRVRAIAGSTHAANRTGVLRPKGQMDPHIGPVEFEARYKGKRGVAVIDSSKQPPILYFTTDEKEDGLQVESRKSKSVLFALPVTDIRQMKKQGGMGWKGKLVVGWAMGSKEVVDGLLIVGKDAKQSYQLTAIGMRDQLFNRLIAIGGQVWERC